MEYSEQIFNKMGQGEIVLYQPDETVKLEVRMEDETVWLTQAQMVELFCSTKQNISLHINNIFKEKELVKDSVVKNSLTTASDGKKYRTNFYNHIGASLKDLGKKMFAFSKLQIDPGLIIDKL